MGGTLSNDNISHVNIHKRKLRSWPASMAALESKMGRKFKLLVALTRLRSAESAGLLPASRVPAGLGCQVLSPNWGRIDLAWTGRCCAPVSPRRGKRVAQEQSHARALARQAAPADGD